MAHVLVLGATSAIAAEASLLYAARGDRVHLVGRAPEKLAAIAARCVAVSSQPVSSQVADFSALARQENVLAECMRILGGVDLVLIAHGELGNQLETETSFAAAEAILRVNFLSPVALLIPIANAMEAQRGGRIGVITSVAGDRGRPRNYTYGAAKGALCTYLQGLRTRLYSAGVTVTTLKLGPVDSPMTGAHKKNALFAKPQSVAVSIVSAIDAGASEVYVPGFWRVIMAIVRNMPEALMQRLAFLSGR